VIVMITGENDRTVMTRVFEAGVQFFLFEPVDRSKLLQLIRATGGTIERERRRFMRVRLRCKVSIDSPHGSLYGNTLDLSLGGALVQAERTFPPGTLRTVSLEIEPSLAPLRSAARIVRVIGTDCLGTGRCEEFSIAPRVQISPESRNISECAPLLATQFPSQASLRQILS
jgi:hypothetical protein